MARAEQQNIGVESGLQSGFPQKPAGVAGAQDPHAVKTAPPRSILDRFLGIFKGPAAGERAKLVLAPEEAKTAQTIRLISIIGGASLFVVAILAALLSPTVGAAMLVLAAFVGIVPYSTWNYIQYAKYKKMEDHFPAFMRDLAEAKKSGMTFPQAIELASKAEYGALTPEIKRAANQLSWGLPFPKVLVRMANRTRGSKIMRQAFAVVTQAFNSGGDVAETMDSIAMNIGMIREISNERKAILGQQVFIMYFIYFLFLGIIIVLYRLMIPMLALRQTVGAAGAAGAAGGVFLLGGVTNYCEVALPLCIAGQALGMGAVADPLTYFKSLFFFMVLVQAAASGIIAGVIGEGYAVAGLRHVAIMSVIAIVAFAIFIIPG